MKKSLKVNWQSYAQKYDMILKYNPHYQNLVNEVLDLTKDWKINAGDKIVDIGAGTGNYSIPLANLFPQAKIYHIDNDMGMNTITNNKKQELNLQNHKTIQKGIDDLFFKPNSIKAILSIHSLYTFQNPVEVIEKIYSWLEPGGYAILVDAGRIVNVWKWQFSILKHLLLKYGVKKSLAIFKEGGEVSRQNKNIRNYQKNGVYWTHTHHEFLQTVEAANFKILESRITFQGISDLVFVKKTA